MAPHSELSSFDGLDNRRELMSLLQRLGSDFDRAQFLGSLVKHSRRELAGIPSRVCGPCDAVAAYFILVGMCNELGVSVNKAAQLLEVEVRGR